MLVGVGVVGGRGGGGRPIGTFRAKGGRSPAGRVRRRCRGQAPFVGASPAAVCVYLTQGIDSD